MLRILKTNRRLYSSMAKVLVSPTVSHVSSKVNITGHGFKPNTPLTIQGRLLCPEEGFDFQSYAHIYTNNEGCFDLKSTESIGGTYRGIDQMGLFWSMVTQVENYVNRANFLDGLRKLTYDFNIFNNHVDNFSQDHLLQTSASCTRFLAENVVKQHVKDGSVRGTLFLPENGKVIKRPGVIVLKGGLKKRGYLQEEQAALLAHEGFVAFNLGFFGLDDLPINYSKQPIRIEYFEEAVKYMQNLEEVNADEVYILGVSKGADISLSMMSYLPQIKKVCWLNGDIASTTTKTTYKGEVTEELRNNMANIKIIDSKTMDIFAFLDNPAEQPNSIHNFHRSKADLLFIVGMKDRSCNSPRNVRVAKDRLDSHGKTNYTIAEFPDLGHHVDAPFTPVCVYDSHPLIPKGMRLYNGVENIRAASHQQLEAWKTIVRFFKGFEKSKL